MFADQYDPRQTTPWRTINQGLLQPQGELYHIQTIFNHRSRDQLLEFRTSFYETVSSEFLVQGNFKHTQLSQERWYWRDSNLQPLTPNTSAVSIELDLTSEGTLIFFYVQCFASICSLPPHQPLPQREKAKIISLRSGSIYELWYTEILYNAVVYGTIWYSCITPKHKIIINWNCGNKERLLESLNMPLIAIPDDIKHFFPEMWANVAPAKVPCKTVITE